MWRFGPNTCIRALHGSPAWVVPKVAPTNVGRPWPARQRHVSGEGTTGFAAQIVVAIGRVAALRTRRRPQEGRVCVLAINRVWGFRL